MTVSDPWARHRRSRARRLARSAPTTFGLDLADRCVLTEAATGPYRWTPIIAALAGAAKVFAVATDTAYAPALELADGLMEEAHSLDVNDSIEIVSSKFDPDLSLVDIVTNLGPIRPIDRQFVSRLRRGAAVPLMWEAWEFRPDEFDLPACRDRDVMVLGTDESHPNLKTIRYIGHAVIHELHKSRIEVLDSVIGVLGTPRLVDPLCDTLEAAGAAAIHAHVTPEKVETGPLVDALDRMDSLVLADYHGIVNVGAEAGPVPRSSFQTLSNLLIVHLCGRLDADALRSSDVPVRPSEIAPVGYMSLSAGGCGDRPVIHLNAAGLKVGQVLVDAYEQAGSAQAAERFVAKNCEYADGFD